MFKNIFVSLLVAGTLFSQSFTLVQHQTSQTDTLGTEIIFYFSLINTGSTPLNFYVKRTANILPEEWQSSLCFSSCFAPFIDSIVNNETFSSAPLPPGDTASVSVHIFTMIAQGTASVTLRFGNVDNPSDTVSRSVYAATLPTGLNDNEISDNYLIMSNYPNPFNPETTVNFSINKSGFTDLSVVSPEGRVLLIFSQKYYEKGSHQIKIDFNRLGLSSGAYIIRLQSGNLNALRKAVFLK